MSKTFDPKIAKTYKDRLDKLADIALNSKTNHTQLTNEQRSESVKATEEYYQYLKGCDIPYGAAALAVVKNEGPFGKIANIHLKHQAIFEGIKPHDIPIIRDNLKISLAYLDAYARRSAENISYNKNNG